MARFLDWLAYQIVMRGPFWLEWRSIDAEHWLGKWALPRAAAHAYRDRQHQ